MRVIGNDICTVYFADDLQFDVNLPTLVIYEILTRGITVEYLGYRYWANLDSLR